MCFERLNIYTNLSVLSCLSFIYWPCLAVIAYIFNLRILLILFTASFNSEDSGFAPAFECLFGISLTQKVQPL